MTEGECRPRNLRKCSLPGSWTHLYSTLYIPLFFRLRTFVTLSRTLMVPNSKLPSGPAENPESKVQNGICELLQHTPGHKLHGGLGTKPFSASFRSWKCFLAACLPFLFLLKISAGLVAKELGFHFLTSKHKSNYFICCAEPVGVANSLLTSLLFQSPQIQSAHEAAHLKVQMGEA